MSIPPNFFITNQIPWQNISDADFYCRANEKGGVPCFRVSFPTVHSTDFDGLKKRMHNSVLKNLASPTGRRLFRVRVDNMYDRSRRKEAEKGGYTCLAKEFCIVILNGPAQPRKS